MIITDKILIYQQVIDENNEKPKYDRNNSLVMKFNKYSTPIFLAQLVSLFICGTVVVNSHLSDEFKINIPTLFTPSWFLNVNDFKKICSFIKSNCWKYFFISLVDVEANYFIIKAYSLTMVTTIQVIDAFILPITLILSYLFLKQKFKSNHFIGVCGCLFGCAFIILADYYIKGPGNEHKLLGDLFCLISSILYAISNVSAEYLIKQNSKREYLAMLGFFGTIISLIQMFLFEKNELADLLILNNSTVWKLFLLMNFCMFMIYALIPCVIELSSAAFLNINLLTADFYSVIFGIFIKGYKLHMLYFAGFICILIGTVLYCLSEPNNQVTNNDENELSNNNKNTKLNNEFSI